MSCPICQLRKEKRFCLALHDRICAQCCGEQREVTLDCPSDCSYLQQARQHEKPREFGEVLPDEMFPAILIREDFLNRYEPFIGGILQTLGRISAEDRKLNDSELIGVLANMAKSYQTLANSGLVYQESLQNPTQQALVDMLRNLLQEFRELEQKHTGRTNLKDDDVLKALVFVLRLAHLHTSGRPRSRRFIDFLQERLPAPPASSDAASPGRIIIP